MNWNVEIPSGQIYEYRQKIEFDQRISKQITQRPFFLSYGVN
jgi:hypothetical protein